MVLGTCSVSPSPSFLVGAVALLTKRLVYPLSTRRTCFLSLLRVTLAECDCLGSIKQAPNESSLHMLWVVGFEVKVAICVCWLPVHIDVEAAVFHPFYTGD